MPRWYENGNPGEKERRKLEREADRILRYASGGMGGRSLRQKVKSGQAFSKHLNNQAYESEVEFKKIMESKGLEERRFSEDKHREKEALAAHRGTSFKYWQNFPVGDYWLDFAWPNWKVGIEVDGGIHRSRSQSYRDGIRQLNLTQLGWKIYHVRYPEDMKIRAKVLCWTMASAKEFAASSKSNNPDALKSLHKMLDEKFAYHLKNHYRKAAKRQRKREREQEIAERMAKELDRHYRWAMDYDNYREHLDKLRSESVDNSYDVIQSQRSQGIEVDSDSG